MVRVILRGSGLLWGIVGCLAEYFVRRLAGRLSEQTRIEVLHRWSRRTLPRMGIAIEAAGPPIAAGLIASNHLSYLDILVYSAIAPCAFVSKREVRSWPGVGWIATLAGTIYVDRSRRSETHAIQPEIQSALNAGLRLFLFPEGASTPRCFSRRSICKRPSQPRILLTPYRTVTPGPKLAIGGPCASSRT
jgi:1-acyl-sn-glycerol-3-phosphate acyltransferase